MNEINNWECLKKTNLFFEEVFHCQQADQRHKFGCSVYTISIWGLSWANMCVLYSVKCKNPVEYMRARAEFAHESCLEMCEQVHGYPILREVSFEHLDMVHISRHDYLCRVTWHDEFYVLNSFHLSSLHSNSLQFSPHFLPSALSIPFFFSSLCKRSYESTGIKFCFGNASNLNLSKEKGNRMKKLWG